MTLQGTVGKRKSPDIISASVFTCEKVLREVDGVLSFIRVVEVFYVAPSPEIATDKQAVQMVVVATVRAEPTNDDSEHAVELRLTRPNGDVKKLEGPHSTTINANIPEVPGGFGIILPIGVIITQLGTHYISLLLDGSEIAKTSFTLLERKAEAAS
jgi:hypothetical protein